MRAVWHNWPDLNSSSKTSRARDVFPLSNPEAFAFGNVDGLALEPAPDYNVGSKLSSLSLSLIGDSHDIGWHRL
jgi:hypothetical protein